MGVRQLLNSNEEYLQLYFSTFAQLFYGNKEQGNTCWNLFDKKLEISLGSLAG